MRAIRGAWSGDDRRMRGESQAGQNAIRKNAEIVTERDIHVRTCVRGRCPRAHARVYVRTCARGGTKELGLCPKIKNEWNKWENHFYEMKGDVGMSLHEKERNEKMPTP